MFRIFITGAAGVYFLKLAYDGFARGKIQLSREAKDKSGSVTAAKYVEGSKAKIVAAFCTIVGFAMCIFAMSDFQTKQAQDKIVDDVTKSFIEGKK
jgi:hypothetical protein